MSDNDTKNPGTLVVNLKMPMPDATKETFDLEQAELRNLLLTLQKMGLDTSYSIAAFGARVLKGDALNETEEQRLNHIFRALHEVSKQWSDPEREAIGITYQFLRNSAGRHGWADAAEFASLLLGYEVTPDAWRKRVEREAQKEGWPKVEIYKRRSSKTDK